MYVGGPVWGLDWCPRLHESSDSRGTCEVIWLFQWNWFYVFTSESNCIFYILSDDKNFVRNLACLLAYLSDNI